MQKQQVKKPERQTKITGEGVKKKKKKKKNEKKK